MERLTNTGTNGEIWITDNDETRRIGKKEASYKKLKAYEDAEEQGLLLRLPFKVGSNIYRITDDGVEVAVCREMTVADKEMYIESVTLCDWISFDEIGKSVFLTRDEAEAKLKKWRTKRNVENKNHIQR